MLSYIDKTGFAYYASKKYSKHIIATPQNNYSFNDPFL